MHQICCKVVSSFWHAWDFGIKLNFSEAWRGIASTFSKSLLLVQFYTFVQKNIPTHLLYTAHVWLWHTAQECAGLLGTGVQLSTLVALIRRWKMCHLDQGECVWVIYAVHISVFPSVKLMSRYLSTHWSLCWVTCTTCWGARDLPDTLTMVVFTLLITELCCISWCCERETNSKLVILVSVWIQHCMWCMSHVPASLCLVFCWCKFWRVFYLVPLRVLFHCAACWFCALCGYLKIAVEVQVHLP